MNRVYCKQCGEEHEEELNLSEKPAPSITICHKCLYANTHVDEIVEQGGVWWRCKKCGNIGALTSDSPGAKRIKKMGACGVLIGVCPLCTQC